MFSHHHRPSALPQIFKISGYRREGISNSNKTFKSGDCLYHSKVKHQYFVWLLAIVFLVIRANAAELNVTFELRSGNNSQLINRKICNFSLDGIHFVCDDLKRTYGNSSSITLKEVDIDFISRMHFDFCSNIQPMFLLLDWKNTSDVCNYVSTNSTNTAKGNFDISCAKVSQLSNDDLSASSSFNGYKELFDRLTYCSHLDPNDERDNQKSEDCEMCLPSYKDWLCSSYFPIRFSNVCPTVQDRVCLYCPSIPPDSDYGGYSAFECESERGSDIELLEQPECSCSLDGIKITDEENCVTWACLNQLHPKNNTNTTACQ